jgi:hypothetical protein
MAKKTKGRKEKMPKVTKLSQEQVDGKTMWNAIDEDGNQTHIMSVIGHESAACYTQKK